jgi:hypothetical protein
VPQKQPPAKTAVARPGEVASGTSILGREMGPWVRDCERQAMVESETVSARRAVAAERRRIRYLFIDMTCEGGPRMLNYARVRVMAIRFRVF